MARRAGGTAASIAPANFSVDVPQGQNVLPDVPADLDWLYVENVNSYRLVGTPTDTAQVTPFDFTTAMADLAVDGGARVVFGRATSINRDDGRVVSLTFTPKGSSAKQTFPATDVVLCTGPWASQLYPPTSFIGLCQNSVVIRPSRLLSAYMLFTEISLAPSQSQPSQHVMPEIFSRPNGTVWAAAEPDPDISMPETLDEVAPDLEACENIVAQVGSISPELRKGTVITQQRCYLPNIKDDIPGPILGRTEVAGLWVAVGHSCWGIQNGPGTGKVMAEYVYDGVALSAEVSELDIGLISDPMAVDD
ncbi:hypothetical protein N0V90_011288 [Kalmusia sp. IMI 367209]|nr:hypothetical protein N0V90_011288 [Kalmusia sp. IMI 367209]